MPVRGADAFRDLARDLRAAGATGLARELGRGLDAAVAPLDTAIRAEATAVMPARYGRLLTPSLRIRASRAQLRMRVIVSAKARGEDRDVARLERGELRHPVYGRSRRGRRRGERIANPWATTTVRRGFVSRPFTASLDDVTKHVLAAVDTVAKKLENG